MVTFETLQQLASTFPEVEEQPHFEKTSFRVKKKIFITYDQANHRASLKLSELDQDIFSKAGKSSIFPVDNKWGKQGWTFVEMQNVDLKLFTEAVKTAYCEVAPKKLKDLVILS